MGRCSEYENQGDGSIPPSPTTFEIKNGAGHGGETDVFIKVNEERSIKGWPLFEWNEALYRSAYHTSRYNSRPGNRVFTDHDPQFSSTKEQMKYYGFHSNRNVTSGGTFGPKRDPDWITSNKKIPKIWTEMPGFLEIGIANVGGWWTFTTSDENECKEEEEEEQTPNTGLIEERPEQTGGSGTVTTDDRPQETGGTGTVNTNDRPQETGSGTSNEGTLLSQELGLEPNEANLPASAQNRPSGTLAPICEAYHANGSRTFYPAYGSTNLPYPIHLWVPDTGDDHSTSSMRTQQGSCCSSCNGQF